MQNIEYAQRVIGNAVVLLEKALLPGVEAPYVAQCVALFKGMLTDMEAAQASPTTVAPVPAPAPAVKSRRRRK